MNILEVFKKKANLKHPTGWYNYDNVSLHKMSDRIDILCLRCNTTFQQVASRHLQGRGCFNCRVKNTGNTIRDSPEEFDNKVKSVHGETQYIRIGPYINNKTKVVMRCTTHNIDFNILPANIKKGHRCPSCARESQRINKSNCYDKFVKLAHMHHAANEYDYTDTTINHSHDRVTIRHNVCGKEFQQLAYSHVNIGNGCPYCAVSKAENEINTFIEIDCGLSTIRNNRHILGDGKELDIYIPSLKKAIEHDGTYRHSELSGGKSINYHLDKTDRCEAKGIQLIHIFENEWLNKKDICKSMLRSKLGRCTNKLYARKCDVRHVSISDSRSFLDNSHIQGDCNSTVKLGLYMDEELVALMTFGKPRYSKKYEWEIVRYCNKLNTTVVGAAGKLLKAFQNEYNPSSIISYADRRWSNGNLYSQLGMVLTGISKPRYWYMAKTDYLHLYHRSNYTKARIHIKYPEVDMSRTEWDIMQEKGYDRIWDCGQLVYTWYR